jgi:RND family efflux transporter MFP subunit
MWTPRTLLRVLCSGSLLAAGCHSATVGSSAAADNSAAPVHHVTATGRVEGWREADVASKLPGRVLRFEHQEGDNVAAGAPVVQLENLDLQARVRAAAARARRARLDLARMQTLETQAIVSASELDRATSTYQAAAAALDEAQLMLEYTTIRAPFRGTVLRKFKEVGEGVATSGSPDPVFHIADLSELKITAEVPEIDIAAVWTGQPAELSADAYEGARFAATVSRIGAAVGRKRFRSDNPREQLDEKVIEVELALPGDARLKSGMTVDVVFDPPLVHPLPAESDALANVTLTAPSRVCGGRRLRYATALPQSC